MSRPIVTAWLLAAVLLCLLLPGLASAQPNATSNCLSCHADYTTYVLKAGYPTPTIQWGVHYSGTNYDGSPATLPVNVTAGSSFELDFIFRDIADGPTNGGTEGNVRVNLALPTSWTAGSPGAGNQQPIASGWNTNWNNFPWISMGTVFATPFPSSPASYSVQFQLTNYNASGTSVPGAAYDNGSTLAAPTPKDLDLVAEEMGADVLVTVPAGTPPGTYTVKFFGTGHVEATNKTEKASVIGTMTVNVVAAASDSTAPVPGTVTVTPQSGTYVPAAFTVTTSFTDAESAVTACAYTLNGGGAWTAGAVSGTGPYTCTANVTGQTNGTALTVNMRATSGGGTATATSIARTVDAAAPTTTSNAPAGWQAADVNVTLTPNDGTGSGVSGTQYCVDTTNSCVPGTSGTTVNVTQGAGTAGTQYVRFRSTDNLSNVETTKSATVQIDKAGPADGTLTVTPGNAQNGLSWTAATDSASGLRTSNTYDLRFLTGATPPTCATGTSIYTGTGTSHTHSPLSNGTQYSYRLCAYDNLNNVSTGATGSGTPSAAASVPTLTSPTATAITNTTATLGATVTADGGAALSARGTCWGTTAAPTGNCVAEGGTTVAAFTQARTALTAGTLLYYRGYATNVAGTGYSPDGSFYTEPTTQASGVTFSGVTSSGMTVNWTRGSGDGVIVLMKSGAAVDSNPVDGTYTGYTANAAFGSGTQAGTGNYVLYKGTGTSVAVTGLSASTTYHVAVYEYKGTVDTAGVNQGVNYKLTPPTGSQATSAPANNAPAVPSALAQYQSDGSTVLASGGAATNNIVVFKATVSDPDSNKVILEVDINLDGTPDCVSGAVTGPTTATATCTALADGSYSWQARAKDSIGAASAWTAFTGGPPDFTVSLGIDIGIDTTPPTESGLTATPGDTVIALTWNPADDGSGSGLNPTSTYKVVRSTVSTPADCSAAGIYTGNFNNLSDTGLTNGTTYYYRVCAYDRVGNVSAGQTTSGTPGSSCTVNTPTVSILGSNKTISVDGGFADYTVQVTNNDVGACAAGNFDLVAVDSNGTAFYASTFASDPLNIVAGGSVQTTIRVTARANQSNGTTNSTYFYTAAGGGHAQSANSNAMTTTISISGGGCVAAGNYLNANGDQLTTSR